jgi:hypothetical protein
MICHQYTNSFHRVLTRAEHRSANLQAQGSKGIYAETASGSREVLRRTIGEIRKRVQAVPRPVLMLVLILPTGTLVHTFNHKLDAVTVRFTRSVARPIFVLLAVHLKKRP